MGYLPPDLQQDKTERSVCFANKSFLPRFFSKKRARAGGGPRRGLGT